MRVLLLLCIAACATDPTDGNHGGTTLGSAHVPADGEVLDVSWTRPSVCASVPCPFVTSTSVATFHTGSVDWGSPSKWTDTFTSTSTELLLSMVIDDAGMRPTLVLLLSPEGMHGDTTWMLKTNPDTQYPFHVEMYYR